MIEFHHFVSPFHSELFVERHGVLMRDEIHRDVPFTARQFKRGFHQTSPDSLTHTASVNAQICHEQPVRKIRHTQQNTDNALFFVSGYQADRSVFQQFGDTLVKTFQGILGP